MDKLKEIIRSNIEWFWGNDPMLEYETDTRKLWDGYKVWCIQNCIEVLEDEGVKMQESQIIKEVDTMYDEWLEAQ